MKNQKEQCLTPEAIETLFRALHTRRLAKIPKMELIGRIKHQKVQIFLKSKKEGIETCYHGYFNGSQIIVCTTHSDFRDDLKIHDVGWVLLISSNSDEPLFSFPIRTKNYCENILAWLDCYIDIANKWPTLPGTTIPLRLIRVKGRMHMRRFAPPKESGRHPWRKPYNFWIIEMELNPKNSTFMVGKFKRYYTYRNKDD